MHLSSTFFALRSAMILMSSFICCSSELNSFVDFGIIFTEYHGIVLKGFKSFCKNVGSDKLGWHIFRFHILFGDEVMFAIETSLFCSTDCESKSETCTSGCLLSVFNSLESQSSFLIMLRKDLQYPIADEVVVRNNL